MRSKGDIVITHLVHLSNLFHRVNLVNLGLELTRLEQTEEFIGVVLKLLTCLDIAEEGGTSNLDTLGR